MKLYGQRILVRILINWAITAVAFMIMAWLLDGVTIHGGVLSYLWVAALFGLVNVVAGTILRLVTLPLTVITFGLSLFVVNAVVLEITDWLTTRFDMDHFFWTAIWAAIILSLVSASLELAAWAARRAA